MTIAWASSFKYLGIWFTAGANLQIDCLPVKKKFYIALNSILNGCKTATESVKVYLIRTYCLPILTYCIGALKLSAVLVKSLSVCWNDAFRKVFQLNRWESMSYIQYFCGDLSFRLIYDSCRWNFLQNCSHSCYSVRFLSTVTMFEFNWLSLYSFRYGYDGNSSQLRKQSIKNHFRNILDLV